MMKKKHVFLIALVLFLSLLYFLNKNHGGQQGIYKYSYIPLAESILTHFEYKLNDVAFDTYPMWGYPFLLSFLGLSGFDYDVVFYFQYLLLVISLFIFFRHYDFYQNKFMKNFIIFLLLVCYTLVLSVKWPDAIVAFLLFLTAFFHLKKKFVWSSLMLGIAYNFRTEYLFFLVIYLLIILFQYKEKKVLFSLLLILPYVMTNLYFHKAPIFTTTNSGGVLYITLGQLPGNPWGRIHKDEEAYNYIHQKTDGKIANPWSREAKPILLNQFKKDVTQYPLYFVKKVFYNLYSLLKGGFYQGEYQLTFIDKKKVHQITTYYKQNKKQFFNDLFAIKKEAIGKALNWGMSVISRIALLMTIVLLIPIIFLYKKYLKENFALCFLILTQVGICMFVQYESRHISKLIGILLMIIAYSSFKRDKRQEVV